MLKNNFSLTTSLLLRVGRTETIFRCYNRKYVEFGCAANWIDYALKTKNVSTGDYWECIFAHLPNDDSRLNVLDSHGIPMKDNLFMLYDDKDNSWYLRFMPTILMPALCFYTFDKNFIIENLDSNDTNKCCFQFDKYAKAMEYEDDYAYLLIKDPLKFFQELITEIPKSIERYGARLSSECFYKGFNPKEPCLAQKIDYNKFPNGYFSFQENYSEEIFWKRKNYEWQSEARFVIPHIHFKQKYFENKQYKQKKNTLRISLPSLQTYAEVYSSKDAHGIAFERGLSNSDIHYYIYK